MKACSHYKYRNFACYVIQIIFVWKSFFISEIIMIPAFAFNPCAAVKLFILHSFCNAFSYFADAFGSCEIDAPETFGIMHKMHVGIVESRQDQTSCHINFHMGTSIFI
ncbi:hypothetical protein SDC9_169906 [bioreactor metagenome]|uniref:Uncharacterized protein n=1 Tax=bioreactor metagenome TaxID=1076179 RepID=A0A645GFH2_9ZZZZ